MSTIRPISQLPEVSQVTTLAASSPIVSTPIITPNTEIGPAVAMSDQELACFYAVRFVLRSHKQLNESDLQYAANYISSFYSFSQDQLRDNPTASNYLTEDQLIRFLIYANERDIGKFALTFNDQLDSAIKNRNNLALNELLLGPKEMFLELYNNPYLTNQDREFLIRLVSREEYATTLVLGHLRKKLLNLETVDDTCHNTELIVQKQRQGNMVRVVSLATKCYGEVCIQDAKILSDDLARATMSTYEKPTETVYTIDKPRTAVNPQTYCFNTLDLIAAITENIPINPISREPFSDYALGVIRQRFRKEIAMYRRYKEARVR